MFVKLIWVLTGLFLRTACAPTAEHVQVPPPPPRNFCHDWQQQHPEWIWCDDFEKDRTHAYFEYQSLNDQFLREKGVGINGSHGMRALYIPGWSKVGSLHVAFGKTPSSYFKPVDSGKEVYKELYWQLYLKNQPGWRGGGGDKLSRAIVFATGYFAQAAIGHIWSGAAPGPHQDFLIIDPASGTDEAGRLQTTRYNDFPNLRWLGFRRGKTPLFSPAYVGQWYCIEAHMKLNDSGQTNGVLELWANDRLEARREGLNWVGSYERFGINALYIENYWNAAAPVEQERYLDNLVISTARIGCHGSA